MYAQAVLALAAVCVELDAPVDEYRLQTRQVAGEQAHICEREMKMHQSVQ
jgi:hypothetical protein